MTSKILMTALAVGLLGSGAANAANDEPEAAAKGGSKFYQKVDVASCGGGTCTATFTKVPGGKVLQTTNLSCSAVAGSFNAIPAFATLQVGSTILTYMPLIPFSGGSKISATGSNAGAVFIDKGKTPSVVIAGGATSATCTLSGALVSD